MPRVLDGTEAGIEEIEEAGKDHEMNHGGGGEPPEGGGARRRWVALALGAAGLLAAAGAVWALSTQPLAPGPGAGSGSGSAAAEEAAPAAVAVGLEVSAEGWGEGSSPFIAHVVGETAGGGAVDFYHAVWPDGTGALLELEEGVYTVTWVSAISADGSIYRTEGVSCELAVDGGGGAVAGGSFERIPAEGVAQGDLDRVLGEIADAVERGDETLSGEAGQQAVDAATGNAAKNPNADREALDAAREEAEAAVPDEPAAGGVSKPSDSGSPSSSGGAGSKPSGGSSSSGSSSSKPSGGNSSSSSGGSGSKPSGGGSSAGGSSSGGGSEPSKPAHTHSWQPVTEQRWVVDQAAWTEQVMVGEYIQCACGATFGTYNEWKAHTKAASSDIAHNYKVVPKYETVYHDEVGHYETVTTGYRCSGCGATK